MLIIYIVKSDKIEKTKSEDYLDDTIRALTEFQESFFESIIIR